MNMNMNMRTEWDTKLTPMAVRQSDIPGVDGVRPWRRTPDDGFSLLRGGGRRGRGPARLVPEEGRLLEDLCRIHLGSRLPHLMLTLGGFGRGGAGGFVMPRRGVIVSLLLLQVTELHHTSPVRGKKGEWLPGGKPSVCACTIKLVTQVTEVDCLYKTFKFLTTFHVS